MDGYTLYVKPWNKTVDKVFIKHLIEQKRKGTEFTLACFAVVDLLNIEFDIPHKFIFEDVYCRFHFMKQRYDTFKWLIAFEGTQWDMESNRIIATDEKWEEIFRINPFTKVYYRRGDPLYDDLMVLYGLDDVKEEEKSDPSKKVPDHGDSEEDSVEEVTSPPFNTVSRRLFTGPSTSDAPPPRGKDPRKAREETDRSRCSSTSTSPLMWWKP